MRCATLLILGLPFAASSQTSGVSAEWEVRKDLDHLVAKAQAIHPLVEQVKPEALLAAGAPETYAVQAKTAQAEAKYLVQSSEILAKQPERLTAALDTYFRLEALESTLGSVIEGVRKYQSPDLANQLQIALSENFANREKLRQHVNDLAAAKERELQVMDQEAQRCRGDLSRQHAPVQPRRRKSERK